MELIGEFASARDAAGRVFELLRSFAATIRSRSGGDVPPAPIVPCARTLAPSDGGADAPHDAPSGAARRVARGAGAKGRAAAAAAAVAPFAAAGTAGTAGTAPRPARKQRPPLPETICSVALRGVVSDATLAAAAKLHADALGDRALLPDADSLRGVMTVCDIDDTVLHDAPDQPPNTEFVWLVRQLHALGAQVHLVTARLRARDMLERTVLELAAGGLPPSVYDTLSLAPSAARVDLARVSRWKARIRDKLAQSSPWGCVNLTVGDMWSDLAAIQVEEELDDMDEAMASGDGSKPFKLVRLKDGACTWGLKLPASA